MKKVAYGNYLIWSWKYINLRSTEFYIGVMNVASFAEQERMKDKVTSNEGDFIIFFFFRISDLIWSLKLRQEASKLNQTQKHCVILILYFNHLPMDKIKATLGWRGFHFIASAFSEVFTSIPFRPFLACIFHTSDDELQLKHRYYHSPILLTFCLLTF